MAFCPKCKLEYVEGVKICPDCNVELVDSLEEIETEETVENPLPEDFDIEDVEEALRPYVSRGMTEDEAREIVERAKEMRNIKNYKAKADELNENKSGAPVLLFFGGLGIIFMILNLTGVLSLFTFKGFSGWLTYTVMGCLFFIFIVSGIRSLIKIKNLKPLVALEAENKEKVLDFFRKKHEEGLYKITDSENYEEEYLKVSDQAVKDAEAEFPDLEEGFAFYVLDRFAGDIFNED